MKKRKIYIFNKISRATNYGIGTYMENLKIVLQNSPVEFDIIQLSTNGSNEMKVIEHGKYREIDIPIPAALSEKTSQVYHRNLPCLLKEFIPQDKDMELIFQINFMNDKGFIQHLKKAFRCKILLVIHYTEWSFLLNGNFERLQKIVSKNTASLKNPLEKMAVKYLKNDLKTLPRADKIICIARHTLETFQLFGGLKDADVEVIPNALEDGYRPLAPQEKYDLRRKYNIRWEEKVIVFAGRLEEVKGVRFLIQAFKSVLTECPEAHLFIAGDGDFPCLMKEAAYCWSKISFTGRIDKTTLYELYALADAGVVCSLHEEFGLVALEMMMHALPLIVTKTGGLDEMVKNEVSGLKIPLSTCDGKRQIDITLLAQKIQCVLADSSRAKMLGENARKRFIEKYELPSFREKMLNVYQNM
jgi:glycosyltransferase